MKRIEQSIIQQARQTDLPRFLLDRGEPLRKVGKRWEHRIHDSLIISGNMFYWNSRQKKGNSLDFVMLYYGWSFHQAIQELTASGYTKPVSDIVVAKKPFSVSKGTNIKRVIAYLCKTRNIDYAVVKFFLSRHLLGLDDKGNIVFKIFNEVNELVGAELCGTLSDVRFKGFAEGSLDGYGFNIVFGNPKSALFFESAIDLMSFFQLNKSKIKDAILVSMSGLKENIISHCLEIYNLSPCNAFLCVDNDAAGDEFIKFLQANYDGVTPYRPPIGFKDWNELMSTNLHLKRWRLDAEKA